MTLTPELALAYLKELSADYRAGAVLTADGATLAGDEGLARAARAALSTDRDVPAAGVYQGAITAGKVFAIASPTHAIVVVTGPFALSRVTLYDLHMALAGLGAESAQETSVQRIPHGSVEALLAAAN